MAKFDKQDEDNQLLDEIEVYTNIHINQNLTESDIGGIDVLSPLEHPNQKQNLWSSRFDKINSMTKFFYETIEMNRPSYVRTPLKSLVIINIQNDDKYCFIWSILAHLHPIADSKNGHATRVSIYRKYLFDLSIEGFDFNNGIKFRDVHKFEKLNNLSINLFEKSFCQDQNKWSHKLIPIEISEKRFKLSYWLINLQKSL